MSLLYSHTEYSGDTLEVRRYIRLYLKLLINEVKISLHVKLKINDVKDVNI